MDFKLGKKEYVHDDRTLQLHEILRTEQVHAPSTFDFDSGRKAFPRKVWGNDQYGNCVLAGRANHLLRLERVETRYTPPIDDEQVISEYKRMTGCQAPGDSNDSGLVVLYALRAWRAGWELTFHGRKPRTYKISAFGELNPQDPEQIRAANYILHGVEYGLWLPMTAHTQLQKGEPWDIVENGGPDSQPGTWGGHLVYSKKYDEDFQYALTWGMEIPMTDRFVARYCDESWSVVDDLSYWQRRREIDFTTMRKWLIDIGAIQVEG
jgi:hypothetical protein